MINFKEILSSKPLYGILEAVITNNTINGTALKLAEKKIHRYLTEKMLPLVHGRCRKTSLSLCGICCTQLII